MSSGDSQVILNRIVSLFNEFVGIEIQGFDISEEKRLYIDSMPILIDSHFKDGICVKHNLYLDEPVYIVTLISKGAVYEISLKMKIDIDPDFERVREDDNTLSFITELVNLMTAAVADKYAMKLNRRVLYSPPRLVRHIFSPELIKGIDIRNRPACIIVYEFLFSEADSAIKMFLIY
ncbi:MAG: hypothetical protein N2746_01170 [Deltaproteobacteria bacterium]|nr:hypothetical protein [Deltaproteobacteria bacterium]